MATPTATNGVAPAAKSTDYASVTPTATQNSELSQLYQTDLGRAPDAAGEAYWANAMNNGATIDQVQQSILGSAEYGSDHSKSAIPAGIATVPATYSANLLGTPTQLNIAPNQTVQGQLQNIMDQNNPIIMQARTGALQQANANGLLNSSMAITAGDNAAYSAAIPIAEQDAGVYNNAAGVNAAAANTFAVDNQNAGNAASQYNAGAANTLTGEQLSNQTALTNAQLAAQTSIATNAASNATSVANTAATAASSKAIAQLNATNTANIQGASNTQQLAAAYQNALTNNASMNMDATSKYQTDLAAFNAYKNAVSILDQSAGIPDMSSQLQFNEIDPATGAAATNPNSPANANP
jgi:hypothetical protein